MSSYRQIFKSTAIVGGAKVITLAIGLIQYKVLTMLLGPAGLGVVVKFQSVIDFIGSLSGFGIGSAGVRQIAESAATNDEARLAATVKTLRITAFVTGILGMLLMLGFCRPLAWRTFQNFEYAPGIALVSLAVLFTSVANGQAALLQGMRKLKDLAGCQVAGAIFGAVASITLVYFLRARGVAWYLVATTAFLMLPFWWRARQMPLAKTPFSRREFSANARQLIGLGLAFMASGLLSTGVLYLTPILVGEHLGDAAVGVYGAVLNISSKYVGIVLQAMGADFYPRLTGVANDHPTANRLVNEQTEIGVLIALPGALATLALAPWILHLLSTAEFMVGTEMFRWQAMGVVFRMMCWPMGFILMAKGMTIAFVAIELTFSVLQIGFLLFFMNIWGLEGIGISFMAANIALTIVLALLSRRITGFRWSWESVRLIGGAVLAMALTQACVRLLPTLPGVIAALFITAATGVGSLMLLQKMLQFDLRASTMGKRLSGIFRPAPPASRLP